MRKSSKRSPKGRAKKPTPKPKKVGKGAKGKGAKGKGAKGKGAKGKALVLDRVKQLTKSLPQPTPKQVAEVRDFSKMTFEQQSAYVFNVFPPVELGMVIDKNADHKTDPFAANPLKPAGK